MALFGFEKETLLDLTVNVIPLGILLFFIGAFAVVNPFGFDAVFSGLQFSLMVTMFLLLTVLTYYAGKAVEGAEHETETTAIEDGPEQAEIGTGDEAEHEAETEPELDGETDEESA
jgi:membrane protein implicated in regulation of membrane protease activity